VFCLCLVEQSLFDWLLGHRDGAGLRQSEWTGALDQTRKLEREIRFCGASNSRMDHPLEGRTDAGLREADLDNGVSS
jgi:hypothetical protein